MSKSSSSSSSSPPSSQPGLVGRPLVPFFDANDNVNATLEVAHNQPYEAMDVDARVWNKELGYFEYPADKQPASALPQRVNNGNSSRSNSAKRGARNKGKGQNTTNGQVPASPTSAPMAIANLRQQHNGMKRTNSFSGNDANAALVIPKPPGSTGKLLLTPSMLSSSAPDAIPLANPVKKAAAVEALASEPPRSNSTKRSSSSKQRSRPNTPVKSRNNQQQQKTSPSSAGSERNDGQGATSGKKGKQKGKQELSAVTGKWAWSAFQSSPDPKDLPLPPFLTSSPAMAPTGIDTAAQPEPLDLAAELTPERPPVLAVPPAVKHPPEGSAPSLEAAMTHDLRRLLNIGGG
ncbi:TPA: hypothetical protein N0F65_005618 [Lagenidium giganteum]|uniref:Uncharacterized protein n=1 Tax=Lagenidium giganteum TaxID=4803 RepID=A0AAV2YT26_9STRA|nr:TPA: hypothetical protein N0F65_005618 [Lagenidium giganteum]